MDLCGRVHHDTEQKEDERRSPWLFELGFVGLGPIALSELIRVYKLNDYSSLRTRKNPPWNHRWGREISVEQDNRRASFERLSLSLDKSIGKKRRSAAGELLGLGARADAHA